MSGPEPAVDLATIIDWVEGRLEPDVAAHVTDAAAREPRVREIVAWFRGFHRAAADLPLTDLPAVGGQVLRPAVGQGEQAPVEVVARALFDSRQDVPVADLRSADAVGDLAHLAFASDPADVVLDVRRLGPGQVRIEGRVLAADGVGRAYAAEATGPRMTPVRAVGGGEDGRFRLAELPERVDRLRLDGGDLVLLLQFDVGWARP
jgi:hypothetical protein